MKSQFIRSSFKQRKIYNYTHTWKMIFYMTCSWKTPKIKGTSIYMQCNGEERKSSDNNNQIAVNECWHLNKMIERTMK